MSGKRLLIILFCAIFLAVCFICPQAKKHKALLKKKLEWLALERVLSRQVRSFKGTSGIVVKDLNTKWEISFNKRCLFPSASLVKIPIMAAVFKAAQDGRINLTSKIKLKACDKIPGSGELKNMPVGSEFSVEKLVGVMITDSDNTAANMLIELLGFQYLNRSFKEFGLKNTNLSRKMMEFGNRKNGIENYTTAQDLAYLLEKIYRNKLCNTSVSQRCLGLLKRQKVRDRIPAQLPPQTIVAHKTGLELKVCHDAGIVFAPQGNFLICVLTKGIINSKTSKKFISNIALQVYNKYR